MGDLVSQAVAPFQNKLDAVSGAFNQAGQGDIAGAYKTYKTGTPATPQQNQPDQQDSGYDHIW
jgi:hypothetical protein